MSRTYGDQLKIIDFPLPFSALLLRFPRGYTFLSSLISRIHLFRYTGRAAGGVNLAFPISCCI